MRHYGVTQPSAPVEGNVQVRFSKQPAPDGTMWVGIHFVTPFAEYMIAMPPSVAFELAQTFPEGLTHAARAAQKGNSPLILPNIDPEGIHRV